MPQKVLNWLMKVSLTIILLSESNILSVTILCCLVFPEYAQVIKMLGNGRLEAMCFDGTKRLCHIRGKLRKKVGTSRPSSHTFPTSAHTGDP